MFDKINGMGFKTLLWVGPFVAPDSPEYRDLKNKGLLIMRKSRKSPGILHWWSGYSAAYDLTKPEAVESLKGTLRDMQKKYGMHGFKFDAGDTKFVVGDFKFNKPDQIPMDYTHEWSKFALDFPYNEFRANARMGRAACCLAFAGQAPHLERSAPDNSRYARGWHNGISVHLPRYDRRRRLCVIPTRGGIGRKTGSPFMPGACADAYDAVLGCSVARAL